MNGAINRVCSEVFNRKCEKYTWNHWISVQVLLAKECDQTIRKCSKLMKDDLNEYFDKIIVIFRCLEVIYVLK